MSLIPPPQYAAILSTSPLLPDIGTQPEVPNLSLLGKQQNLNQPNLPSATPLPPLKDSGGSNPPSLPDLSKVLPNVFDILALIGMIILGYSSINSKARYDECVDEARNALDISVKSVDVNLEPSIVDITTNNSRVNSPDETLKNYKVLSGANFEGRNRLQQKALLSLYLGRRLSNAEYDAQMKNYKNRLTQIYDGYAKRY